PLIHSMILFFRKNAAIVYSVGTERSLSPNDVEKLKWLFGAAAPLDVPSLAGLYIGPRKEMVSPWSTNAVEITQTMGIHGIRRIEEFRKVEHAEVHYDRMLEMLYDGLGQDLYTIGHQPEPVIDIDDIAAYNEKEGLALSEEEIDYLEKVSR